MASVDYGRLPTEQSNTRSRALDRMPLAAAVRLMNREDARAVRAVGRAAPDIARAAALIADAFRKGRRLFFAGAGTSGRLGVLEAAECPPTFDTPRDLVQALMAGGRASVFRSKEGAEDRGDEAAAFVRKNVRAGDVLVGVAASGVTAFAREAILRARARGAKTVLVTCNPGVSRALAHVTVAADTGAEVLSGSTRLKAGTATKMILNTLTTLAMARAGKTYGNFMVDLQPRSKKLVARGLGLIRRLGGADAPGAEKLFKAAGGRVKTAILMARRKVGRAEAERRLKKAGGFLGKALGVLLLAAGLRAEVLTGLDVLEKHDFAELKGKRVGVIVNRASVDRQGRSLVDLLEKSTDPVVTAIFTPEHGYTARIAAGRRIDGGKARSGVPVYSLYGDTLRPTPEMLAGLDVLVFDLQDAGARFYTYITTMGYAMEEAGKAGVDFMVLDRPNPLGGEIVEGEILDTAFSAFTGYCPVPVRHGMTVGEIARMHAAATPSVRLTVVPMEGWRRDMLWDDTGLRFTPPSPNIRSPRAALLYAGLGAFESTNLSVGRGGPAPFSELSAPWLDARGLVAALNKAGLPGFSFRVEKNCARVIVTDPRACRPVDLFVQAAWALRTLHPAEFRPRWDEMPVVTGSREFQKLYEEGEPVEQYLSKIRFDALRFSGERHAFLLYP